MVYEYDTNKEFIDKSYQLLEKLENRGLWNKDTLIVGLDKGVRSLAYTLRKLAKEQGKENPEIRYFNFSSDDQIRGFTLTPELAAKQMKPIRENGKRYEKTKKPEDYKKILILDEHIYEGKTLLKAENFFKEYFSKFKRKPKIFLSALGYQVLNIKKFKKRNLIVLGDEKVGLDSGKNGGIMDEYEPLKKSYFLKSIPIKNKEIRKEFIKNRKQLSKDIKKYIHKKHPELTEQKTGKLEKTVETISILSLIAGGIIGTYNITGNVIGNYNSTTNILGVVLILIGIIGFVSSRKLSSS